VRRAYLDNHRPSAQADEVAAFRRRPFTSRVGKAGRACYSILRIWRALARHWLDVARSRGEQRFETRLRPPFAFHYRDFVINALNADMPFDQFTRWQIAGVNSRQAMRLAMTATGFLGAGVFPTQDHRDEVERTRYDALDDMLATTGSAFIGLSSAARVPRFTVRTRSLLRITTGY
jgi:hypothetical protein